MAALCIGQDRAPNRSRFTHDRQRSRPPIEALPLHLLQVAQSPTRCGKGCHVVTLGLASVNSKWDKHHTESHLESRWVPSCTEGGQESEKLLLSKAGSDGVRSTCTPQVNVRN